MVLTLALMLVGCAGTVEDDILPQPPFEPPALAVPARSGCDLHGVMQFPPEPGGLRFIACTERKS